MIVNIYSTGPSLRTWMAVLAVLLLGGDASALTEINSCTTASSPGEYVLNRSIIDSDAPRCMNITSSDVTLDGAGHMIGGRATSGTYGVHVHNPGNKLTNVTIKNLNMTEWYLGIYYNNTENGSITNSNVSQSRIGILMDNSSSSILTGNNASSNDCGICLYHASSNTLASNIVSFNREPGIDLYISSSNDLIGNKASSNRIGFDLYYSSNNTLANNIISSNSEYGIYLINYSSYNILYNNYLDNRNNAYDTGYNIWNTERTAGMNIIGGSWLGGNYWSDYGGSDIDEDGLGETMLPHNSSGNITDGGDRLPLVTPAETRPQVKMPSAMPRKSVLGLTAGIAFSIIGLLCLVLLLSRKGD